MKLKEESKKTKKERKLKEERKKTKAIIKAPCMTASTLQKWRPILGRRRAAACIAGYLKHGHTDNPLIAFVSAQLHIHGVSLRVFNWRRPEENRQKTNKQS